MTEILPHLKRLVGKLGFQIAFLLAVALLPLSIISILTSINAARDVGARSDLVLLGVTRSAISGESGLIHGAQGTAAALGAVIDIADCNGVMQRIGREHPEYALISFVDTMGNLRCSNVPLTYDFNSDAVFAKALASDMPSVAVNRRGPVTKAPVLVVSQPVHDPAGHKVGTVLVTLPHGALKPANDLGPLKIVTFDRDGQVLTASSGMETAALQLPQDNVPKNLYPSEQAAFSRLNRAGEARLFAVIPIVDGALYAMGSWPDTMASDLQQTFLSTPFWAPLVMWLASLVVAWLGVERLVIRNIRKLGLSIRSFASGSRTVGDIEMRGAPLEISEIATAYRQMTDSIIQDEAELENIVHQKEVLLREVHHRVKNNLQLIASIMNMHIRKTQNPETREVIRKLQDRVMSLATIHRELYQTVGLADVHASELLTSITTQVIKLSALPDRSVAVSKSFENLVLTPDQAVPLALLLAEALGNALKYDANTGHPTVAIEVSLSSAEKGQAVLLVSHRTADSPQDPARAPSDPDPLSAQLLTAFAAQLGGQIKQISDNNASQLIIQFALRPLSDAEDRYAAKASA